MCFQALLTLVGPETVIRCKNLFGRHFLKHLRPAKSLRTANIRWVVGVPASASEEMHCHVQRFVRETLLTECVLVQPYYYRFSLHAFNCTTVGRTSD